MVLPKTLFAIVMDLLRAGVLPLHQPGREKRGGEGEVSMERTAIWAGCVAVALTALPTLWAYAAPRPHDVLGGHTFPRGSYGCTGPLVGVYGASALKDVMTQAAQDYCNAQLSGGTPGNQAYDVEYSASNDVGTSCTGVDYAADSGDANEVGVSTVFAPACTGGAARSSSSIVDTAVAVNVVDSIAQCPGANDLQGGSPQAPAPDVPCAGNGSGQNNATFTAPNNESVQTAQLLWSSALGDYAQAGGTAGNPPTVQQRIPGSGTRATWCQNLYGPGNDQCIGNATNANTTGDELTDVCGNPYTSPTTSPTAGANAIGYASRAALVLDPRQPLGGTYPLAGCGIVQLNGASGYNGACDPVASASQCPGDADVAVGRYPMWGYLHLDTNPSTANNAAARAFVNFIDPAGQDQEEALLERSGFVPTCEMAFKRTSDAGPYTSVTPTCDPATSPYYNCSFTHCFGINYWPGAVAGAATNITVVRASPGQDNASGQNNPPTPGRLGFVNSEMWVVGNSHTAQNSCVFSNSASDCWVEGGVHVGYFATDARTNAPSLGCSTPCYWYADEAPGMGYHDYLIEPVPQGDFGQTANVSIVQVPGQNRWSVNISIPGYTSVGGFATNNMVVDNQGSFQVGGEIDGTTGAHAPPVSYSRTEFENNNGTWSYEQVNGVPGGFYGSPGGTQSNTMPQRPWQSGFASYPAMDHQGGTWMTRCSNGSTSYQCYGKQGDTGTNAAQIASLRVTPASLFSTTIPPVNPTSPISTELGGVPAITPTLGSSFGALAALTATYTIDDALQFAAAHPFATTDGSTPTITRVSFLPASVVTTLLNGAWVANDPKRLVCYVRVEGALDMSHESHPALSGPLQAAHIGDMVFDAKTGNLLIVGFDG